MQLPAADQLAAFQWPRYFSWYVFTSVKWYDIIDSLFVNIMIETVHKKYERNRQFLCDIQYMICIIISYSSFMW